MNNRRSNLKGFTIALDSGGMFIKDRNEPNENWPLIAVKKDYFIEALNMMGYEIYNIGTFDLVLGREALEKLIDESEFTWISSNVKTREDSYLTKRYVIKNYDGLKVGYFGLLSSNAPLDIFSRQKDFHIQNPVEAAREMVSLLQEKGCHLIIALTSLGFSADQRLAMDVEGIDVIFGGYSRSLLRQPKNVGRTLIVQSGAKGMHLGHLQITVAPDSPPKWMRAGSPAARSGQPGRLFQWHLQPLNRNIANEPEMDSLLTRYKNELKEKNIPEEIEKRRTAPEKPPASAFVGVNVCSQCHMETYREWATSSHAQAYIVLEKNNQSYNPDCLSCHTTGYNRPTGFSTPSRTPYLKGVQCESCHGPGSLHKQPGQILARPGEAVCLPCHNEENSPLFRFQEYLERLGGHAFTSPKSPSSP